MHQTPDRKGDQAACGRDSVVYSVYCVLISICLETQWPVSSAVLASSALVLELHGDDEL